MKFNPKLIADELRLKLLNADGVVITHQEILEQGLTEAYNSGIMAASEYVNGDIGQGRLSEEITRLKRLPSCF